jgi:hypothetical protein
VQDASDKANEKSGAEVAVESALREFVRQDGAAKSRREQKDPVEIKTSIDLLAQRSTSLSEVRNVIRELQALHDFLYSEGERLESEISEYAQLSKETANSTRLIANNILNWRKAVKQDPP